MADRSSDGPDQRRDEDNWSLRASRAPASKKGAGGRRRLIVLLVLLALVLAGAYLARERILHSALASRPTPAPPSASAVAPAPAVGQAVVLSALRKSLAEGAARVELKATVTTRAGRFELRGGGFVDLADGAMRLALDYLGAGRLLPKQLQVISVGGREYLSVPGISRLLANKSWVLVRSAGSLAPGGTDPASFFTALGPAAASIRPLGASRRHGVGVEGYAVLFPKAALLRLATQPAWKRAGSGQVRSLSERLYLQSATRLLEGAEVSLTTSLNGQAVHLSESLALSGYGSRVSIVAPPAGEVATLAQFLARAGSGAKL